LDLKYDLLYKFKKNCPFDRKYTGMLITTL